MVDNGPSRCLYTWTDSDPSSDECVVARMSKFTMYLDDRKVLKQFGQRPWLGKRLPGVYKKVTVGMRWSLPRKQYEPDDDVLVNPTVALTQLRKGEWQVTVEDKYTQEAYNFLAANCM